jgi:enoyl-CoA hydratase/carnithine racemase
MSDSEGSISVEQRGPILLIGLNRPAKYNGYTPTMAKQLVEAFTRLDESNDLFVGVLFGHGDHFTAGLDLPKWTERMQQESRVEEGAETPVDPLALGRAVSQTHYYCGAGHYLYVWHRDCVGRRHRDRGG